MLLALVLDFQLKVGWGDTGMFLEFQCFFYLTPPPPLRPTSVSWPSSGHCSRTSTGTVTEWCRVTNSTTSLPPLTRPRLTRWASLVLLHLYPSFCCIFISRFLASWVQSTSQWRDGSFLGILLLLFCFLFLSDIQLSLNNCPGSSSFGGGSGSQWYRPNNFLWCGRCSGEGSTMIFYTISKKYNSLAWCIFYLNRIDIVLPFFDHYVVRGCRLYRACSTRLSLGVLYLCVVWTWCMYFQRSISVKSTSCQSSQYFLCILPANSLHKIVKSQNHTMEIFSLSFPRGSSGRPTYDGGSKTQAGSDGRWVLSNKKHKKKAKKLHDNGETKKWIKSKEFHRAREYELNLSPRPERPSPLPHTPLHSVDCESSIIILSFLIQLRYLTATSFYSWDSVFQYVLQATYLSNGPESFRHPSRWCCGVMILWFYAWYALDTMTALPLRHWGYPRTFPTMWANFWSPGKMMSISVTRRRQKVSPNWLNLMRTTA